MKLYNATFRKLLKYIKNRTVICYGAGKMLDEMFTQIPEIVSACRYLAIVDGDDSKCGKSKVLCGKQYIVNGVGYLKQVNNPIVIVTPAKVGDILSHLHQVLGENTPVFCYMLMKREENERKVINVDNKTELMGDKHTEQIPKIIHYFWFGRKPIPDEYIRNMDSWRKCCPNYEFLRWDESNCNLDECDYAREAYEQRKYGFVPDYFRLKRIYEFGGIYLDLDVEIIKPLDKLRNLSAYVGFEDNNHVNFGAGFGAKKEFALLKEMAEDYKMRSFAIGDGLLNTIASPVYQTDILKKHGLKCNGKMQIIQDMTILPMNYLSVQSPHTGRRYYTENSLSVHKYSASWTTEEDRSKKAYIERLIASAISI